MSTSPTSPAPRRGSHHADRRNRSIKLAVATSLLSKAGTALLQLVSIPIAIRVLGLEAFGLYSTVALAISIVVLLQVGIGPALTHGISRALAANDSAMERNYYATSFYLILGFALLSGLLSAVVFTCVPVSVLFGQQYAGHAAQMQPALWLGIGIILFQFVLTHTERTREGYLEANINNAWGAAGNVLGAIAVGVGVFFFQTIEWLLLSVYGSSVVAKLGNTVHLLIKRPHLAPWPSRFRRIIARDLITDGVAFSLSGSVTALVEFNAVALIIARLLGPSAVGIFNILVQIDTLLAGTIFMFTTPMWPAVADAFALRDLGWIRAAAKRLFAFGMGYSAAAGLGLVLLGPILISLWLGSGVQMDRAVLIAFSLYFLIGVWNHIHHSLLIGVGKVKEAAAYSLLEAAVILVPGTLGITFLGLPGLFGGMFLTKALITGMIFPRMFNRALRERAFESGDRSSCGILPQASCAWKAQPLNLMPAPDRVRTPGIAVK